MTEAARFIMPRRPRGKYPAIQVGARFGRLVVIGAGESRDYGRGPIKRWICECDCATQTTVFQHSLNSGKIVSCGCYQRDMASAVHRQHGESYAPEYTSWIRMRQRCSDEDGPGWDRYGGRGIKVCERWDGPGGYERFLADVGRMPTPSHSLDRIDFDGHYEPGNVRWATPQEQAANRSTSRFVEHEGRRLTLAGWSKIVGVSASALAGRLNAGLSPKEILDPQHRGGRITVPFRGAHYSLRELAAHTGIPKQVLYERIVRHGWPVDIAVSMPITRSNAHLCAGTGRIDRRKRRAV